MSPTAKPQVTLAPHNFILTLTVCTYEPPCKTRTR